MRAAILRRGFATLTLLLSMCRRRVYFAVYHFFRDFVKKNRKKSDMMPKFRVNCPEKVVIKMHFCSVNRCMQIVMFNDPSLKAWDCVRREHSPM